MSSGTPQYSQVGQGLEPAEGGLREGLDVIVLDEPRAGGDGGTASLRGQSLQIPLPSPCPPQDRPHMPVSPCPHPTHRYCRCDRPAKALSPISVNLLELSRLQREGGGVSARVGRDGHRGTGMPRTGGKGGAPGCPATGVGHVQELQRGDVGESCLSDLREGCVHHRPANETKLQGYVGEERAAEGLCHPPAPQHRFHWHPVCASAPSGCWAGDSSRDSSPTATPLSPTAAPGAGSHPTRAHALWQPVAERVWMHTHGHADTRTHTRILHARVPLQGSGDSLHPQGPGSCVPLGLWSPRSRQPDRLQPCSVPRRPVADV